MIAGHSRLSAAGLARAAAELPRTGACSISPGSPTSARNLFIILGIVAMVVTVIDYVVPIWGTRQFGGSKYGMRGATVGLVIGLFLGPAGIIIGPFIGAVVGELIFKDDIKYALKAGFGSLLGFLTGVGLKLAASLLMTFYFVSTHSVNCAVLLIDLS
ncbi:MAG: DUF456 domain-containing protein [Marinilabiliales bacterium]|nr:DUF456 domain-containing protein [Marinilabiliales bacterium]